MWRESKPISSSTVCRVKAERANISPVTVTNDYGLALQPPAFHKFLMDCANYIPPLISDPFSFREVVGNGN